MALDMWIIAMALSLTDGATFSAEQVGGRCPADAVRRFHSDARYERRNPPPAGVPLLLGIRTGMSRAEVRAAVPSLRSFASGSYELLPGLSLPATVGYHSENNRVSAVSMRANRRSGAVEAALTSAYGPPVSLDAGTIRVGDELADSVPEQLRVLLWCDEGRRIILWEERAEAWVYIQAERPRNRAR